MARSIDMKREQRSPTSGMLRDLSFLANDQAHTASRPGQHVDEAVDAEELNLAAHEIANPRLRHSEQLRCFRLREPALVHQFSNSRHQTGSDPQVSSLVGVEAEISKHVTARSLH